MFRIEWSISDQDGREATARSDCHRGYERVQMRLSKTDIIVAGILERIIVENYMWGSLDAIITFI